MIVTLLHRRHRHLRRPRRPPARCRAAERRHNDTQPYLIARNFHSAAGQIYAVDARPTDEALATHWLTVDRQGNVRDSFRFGEQNGSSLMLAVHFDYADWGTPKDPDENLYGVDPKLLQRFEGGIFDADLQAYKFGDRWLSTALQRWLSEDPSGLAFGTNPYEALNNSPFNFVDPTGNFPILAALGMAAIGMILLTPEVAAPPGPHEVDLVDGAIARQAEQNLTMNTYFVAAPILGTAAAPLGFVGEMFVAGAGSTLAADTVVAGAYGDGHGIRGYDDMSGGELTGHYATSIALYGGLKAVAAGAKAGVNAVTAHAPRVGSAIYARLPPSARAFVNEQIVGANLLFRNPNMAYARGPAALNAPRPVVAGRVRSAKPSAFDEIAAWRANMKLGAPGTKVNGKEYVLSRLDVDGHSPIYGINWDMGHPRPPGVLGQFLKHAEGDALSQAASAGILRGGKATLYVDKTPCDWCWKSFANFSKYHGVEELTVVTPQGVFGHYNSSLGRFVKE